MDDLLRSILDPGEMTFTIEDADMDKLYEVFKDINIKDCPYFEIHDKYGNSAKYYREDQPEPHWIPDKTNEPAKRLNDLIFDINPAEICAQIEADNLKKWCEIIQVEMKMAMVQLPCWEGEADG